MKLNNLKTVMSSMLIVVFCTVSLKAQNAKKLFKNNYKWGINMQLNNYFGSNNYKAHKDSYYYKITTSYVPAIGLRYNFLQIKNWNFNAGLQVNFFGDRDEEYIAPKELPNIGGSWGVVSSELSSILYIPITAEYIFSTERKITYSLGAGFGMSYYQYNEDASGTFDVNYIPISRINYIGNGNYFASGHIKASMYFKTKGGTMFQTSINYKKSFKNYREGEYSVTNLAESPDNTQKFSQSGDYLGLSLAVYLKKKNKITNNLKAIKSASNIAEPTEKKTRFGFKGGLNKTNIRGIMADGNKSGYTGIELYGSFFADTKLSKKWNMENEILFSYTESYHFAEIPVHLKYKLSSRFNILFGPKLDFLIGNVSDYGSDISKYYGVSFEVGSQFKIDKSFFVEFRYSKSFTKQFDFLDFYDGKRNTLRIGVGTYF